MGKIKTNKTKTTREPAKPFVLKNIKARDLQAILVSKYACTQAREWAEKKSLKQVFQTCKRGAWLNWLLYKMTHDSEPLENIKAWGGIKRFDTTQRLADKAYDKAITWEEAAKAEADVYKQRYTVV